jgi:uncharacterized protein (TIGR00369 family)
MTADPPSSPPASPLERVVRAFESIPHGRRLGMRLVLLERARGVLAVPYDAGLIGDPRTGVVHGGVITALLDTLSGLVVMTAVPDGTTVATLDLRIDYLRPATPGAEIRGQAECYKVTSSVAFVRGTAYHDDPREAIAHAAGTFILGATGFSTDGAAARPSGGARC